MCSPMSIAMWATAAGTGAAAYGTYQQGSYAEKVAKANAITQRRMADDAVQRGAKAEMEHRMKVAQIKSRQRAGFGAAGVDLQSGSPLNVIADTAMTGELDALTIRSNAEREAYMHEVGASNTRDQGRMSKLSGTYGAASTLLSGGGRVAEQWYIKSGK